MCGRFAQERPAADLAELFAAEPLVEEPGARPNIAPTDEALVVVERDDRRALVPFRWGLIPHWADSPRMAARTFNARIETIAATPAFRDSFARHRCLVPVDHFYEWRREGRRSIPIAVGPADGGILALAGLWAGWRDPATGTVRRSFTIVTTEADERIADLHGRMPVALPRESWGPWLSTAPADSARLLELLLAFDRSPFRRVEVPPLPSGRPAPATIPLPLES